MKEYKKTLDADAKALLPDALWFTVLADVTDAATLTLLDETASSAGLLYNMSDDAMTIFETAIGGFDINGIAKTFADLINTKLTSVLNSAAKALDPSAEAHIDYRLASDDFYYSDTFYPFAPSNNVAEDFKEGDEGDGFGYLILALSEIE